jgi:predicted transcriptional regulator
MSADDTSNTEETEQDVDTAGDGSTGDVRQRLEREADRAIEQFDDSLVDVLGWLLDTETRARIYVHLRQHPQSTSDEVADGTGLYPSTVREALAELHEEEVVERRKRESDGAGNNPYEYSAIAPSDLVGSVVEDVQKQLNAVCNLDSQFDGEGDDTDRKTDDSDDGPVTITVEDEQGV